MQAMDANGDTVLDNKEAKPTLQYSRKKYLEKKLRKLNRKVAEVQRELMEG